MRRFTFGALAGLLLLPALVATAQESTDLRMEMKQKRIIALPKPHPAQVERDAEQAAADIAAHQRQQELVQESMGPVVARPDLRYDVYSAIQQRNLRRVR